MIQHKQRERDIRFGTWNIRSLYRVGSLTAAARELARYKLDLVGVQEVRWDKWGTVRTEEYTFFLWKRKRKSSIGNRTFVHHRIVAAIKTVEFVSDRSSYIVLRGRWYNIIILKGHILSEKKSDVSRDSFYEELEQILIIFPSAI